jgi:WD40 repeat protein
MAADSSDRLDLFNRLAEEFAARCRRGERPSLQEYVDRHPELADDIRDAFPALACLEQAQDDPQEVLEPPDRGPLPPLEQLGDFRILREIGHGGMGVVYEAEQVSLGRHVALKVLPQKLLLDARTKQRFEREAKAAARLHHTNIVPVFGIGAHEGLPYYVMQFIQGLGLDQVLEELKRVPPAEKGTGGAPRLIGGELPASPRDVTASDVVRALMTGERVTPTAEADGPASDLGRTTDPVAGLSPAPQAPDSGRSSGTSVLRPGAARPAGQRSLTYWQSVAQIGVQVAEALEHAHRQGVLHRDIKPSNLLLDTGGTVWVTDFGLAKADDQQALTQTGDVVGTLRYMPPEAFDGKSDVRGDVYSLGLTLYELAALRPAFDESDRNKLVKQVTTAELEPLSHVRKGVPRDLETIIHKAADRDPARRYQAAGDLAADLQRFLNDEPIRARRQTQLERYLRWARRHPGIAVLGGALTAVLVLATVASLLAAGHFNQLRLAAEEAGTEARRFGEAERWERYRSNIAAASAALQLQNSDSARQALESAPEQHRNWEWWHFHNQLDNASRVLSMPGGVYGAFQRGPTVSPDGRMIMVSAKDGVLYLWPTDTTTGQPIRSFGGHDGLVEAVAVSPDGRQLATGSGAFIRLWDLATGRQLFVLKVGGTLILEYSSDGKRLLSNVYETAVEEAGSKYRLWDTTTGRLIAILGGKQHCLRGAAFSPDGKRAAAAAGKEVRLYDAATGRQLASLGPHEWNVEEVAFSPDGTRLCTYKTEPGGPDTVYLWDGETGNLVARLTDHRARVGEAVFSPEGTILATASLYPENLVRLWDAANGKLLHVLSGHQNSLNDLHFSPDGTRLVTGSKDQTARLWDVKTGAEIAVLRGHSAEVRQAIFSPDSKRLVTGSDDNTMRLWDVKNGNLITVLRGHTSRPFGRFTPDSSRLISSSEDGTARIWDLELLERNGILLGHTSFVYDVAFSPDGGQVASVAWDGTARLWDATTGRQTALLKHPQPFVTSLAYSHDGRTLATANTQSGATLWDLTTARPHLAVPVSSNTDGHTHVALSPDGRMLAYADAVRHSVVLYDTTEQKQFAELTQKGPEVPADRCGVGCPLFSPDGATLATEAGGGTVLLWDVATWKPRGHLPGHTGGAYRFAFSPDSQLLAVGGTADTTLRIWDVRTRAELASLNVGNQVFGLAFSPDGTRLAAGCRDNVIRLIDVATWQEVAELRGHSQYVHAVAWSPDGARIVSGSGDGTVRIWGSLSAADRARRKGSQKLRQAGDP